MRKSKVIAVRGEELELLVETGVDVNDPKAKGVIRNTHTKSETPLTSIQQILKWGYWEKK